MGLRRLWAGEMPLDEAFWSWAVIGGIAVNLVTSLLFWLFVALDQIVAAYVAGYVVAIPYNVIAAVGVWRSAGRGDVTPRKAAICRIVTVIGMVLLSVT